MSSLCHACSRAGTIECVDTFACRSCYKERSVCTHLPGGFEALTIEVVMWGTECVMCAEKRTMSEEFVDIYHKKLGG